VGLAVRDVLAADADPVGGANGSHGEMTRWRAMLARVGARTPAGRDTAVAVALAVLSLARIPLALVVNDGEFTVSGGVLLAANVVATLDFATIAIRRRAPRTALVAATAVALASTAVPELYQLTGLGVVVCAYTVGTLLPRGRATVWAAIGAATHAAGGIVAVRLGGQVEFTTTFWGNRGHIQVDLVLASVATYAIPLLLGLYVQTRRLLVAELTARLADAEAERERGARAAVEAERGRIARDLHDIAAHDLSAIVVQAGAADRQLDRDPAATRATLRAIRTQGRTTLTALRGLVGIIRDDSAGDTTPRPSLRRLDELVEAARHGGTDVTVTVAGTPGTLPVPVDVAAYRVAQEALANARQHAPGAPVRITVRFTEREITLTIHSGLSTTPSDLGSGGHGLVGMAERVRHAGGTLVSGPREDGWQVRATFPRTSD
jgi:signal transduction histidine kinase